MLIAVDFDGVVVEQDKAYDDLDSPLTLTPFAREGLWALKRAGHALLLWSGRASLALRQDPFLDPLVRAGVVRVDPARFVERKPLHEERYRQMLDFVAAELPGVFDAIDDGTAGKPHVDLIIDDRALRFSGGLGGWGWPEIAQTWGELGYDAAHGGDHPSQDVHAGPDDAGGGPP